MTKTIILGSSNPYDTPPLWPRPVGCAGWNLWQMSGMPRRTYVKRFDFRNLFKDAVEESAAFRDSALRRRIGEAFAASVQGRRVVALGNAVRDALGLPDRIVHPCCVGGATYYAIPHPSGRNLFYNDPACRDLVRLLLEDL